MVTSFVGVWSRALRTVSKRFTSGTVISHRQKSFFLEFISLILGNLLMKNNTYTDRSSKVANHLHIQRAGTHFEPGNNTEYRDPSSSFINAFRIFCLMPGTSWRKRLEANSSEWTRHPNSSYLFALPAFIFTFCSMLHIRCYLYTLPISVITRSYKAYNSDRIW